MAYEPTSINNVQYLDWASSVKLFYNKNIFDEFLLPESIYITHV